MSVAGRRTALMCRPGVWAAVLGVMLGLTQTHAAPPGGSQIVPWKGPSFSAEWITYYRGEAGTPEESARVFVNRARGMRRELPPGGPFVEIVSYQDMTIYWLHTARRLYTTVQESDTHPEQADEISALVSEQPCEDFAERSRRSETIEGGRALEVWECRDPRYGRAVHHYDARHRLLIRDQFVATGWTNELRNIRLEEPPASLFVLPTGYKKVSKDEFLRAWLGAGQEAR